MKIDYKKVDNSNYLDAVKLQRTLFPEEDGTFNILQSVDYKLFKKITNIDYTLAYLEYYLMYVDEHLVGISGLYQIPGFKDEMWLGWYGINPNYRRKGYGQLLLQYAIDKAKKMGITTLRLYTDYDDNKNAVKLYEKMGFVGEKYTYENLDYDCRIYSLSLDDKKVTPWGNKSAGINSYDEMENRLNKEDVLKEYESYIK